MLLYFAPHASMKNPRKSEICVLKLLNYQKKIGFLENAVVKMYSGCAS